MSCSIVKNEVINTIIAGLWSAIELDIDIPEVLAHYDASFKGGERIGKRLRRLNERAYYEKNPDSMSEFQEYAYSVRANPTLPELHAALSDFLYQCSEGDVPKTKIFKQLKEFYHDVAHEYVVQENPAHI